MERMMAGLPVVAGAEWPGVRYFCTTRGGGVGQAPFDTFNLGIRAGDAPEAVAENRRRLAAVLPGEPRWLRQVHANAVHDADAPAPQGEIAADASVTTCPGQVLAVMVADCLPVLLADARGQVLGAAHAGWRGLSSGVLENTLSLMQAKRPQAQGWRAWVGPGIGPAHFEVGADVLQAFGAEGDAEVAAHFKPASPGKWLADLPALARLRLTRAGVQTVELSGYCTYRERDRFFSYRRDRETGRMALLAWLEHMPD
ncbi:peptidoglycan editing factor PgeF [Bordetella trematum]|uniref:peptidoglycan editing factor PgeF n=1 Tax=Bordetella trematum TaxID=123899 RepID=UPI001404D871|nr:peptidoglycan editing factor PgeF [Bordetella trematum]QIM72172.1 peptidoglycan editing factor PgeF [Bordetella trematum]